MNEKFCTKLVRQRAVAFDPALSWDAEIIPCERCGAWRRPERHHRQFRSRGGVWVPSNVLAICSGCHLDATDELPFILGTGLNVHSWEEPADVPVTVWYEDEPVLLDDAGTYSIAY